MDYKILGKLNDSLIKLLKNGIVPMNKLDIYHCDLKESNILVNMNDDDSDNIQTKLIDWGLSTIYKPETDIPKVLLNKPFQFNIPFSVVLFNDLFTKLYSTFLKKNPNPTYLIIRIFVINYIVLWVNKRGKGHLSSINTIFKIFFERTLINVKESFKDNVIEYEYTFYYIIEYISQVLFKFTIDNVFDKLSYFSNVFIKNIDMWGFVVTYLPIIQHMNNYYNKLSDNELDIFNKIRELVLYIIECSFKLINPEILEEKLESLGSMIKKSEKSSNIIFSFSSSSSSSSSSKSSKKSSKNHQRNN